jgi:transposase
MSWRSGQSYSQDLRDRVLRVVDDGMPVRQAAPMFGVSIAYIYKALIRRRVTGDARINPNRGHAPRKLSGAQELALASHILSRLGIILAQVQAWLLAQYVVELSTAAIWNVARRLGLSFKKSSASRRAGSAPTWQQGASCGEPRSHSSILRAWSSLTKRE